MDISKLDTRDQLLISLALVDFESAKRIMPEHPIFLGTEDGLAVDWVGGSCPTQSEGTVWGERYYFRARHGEWYLNIGGSAVFDPTLRLTGEDETAGFMEDESVLYILRGGAAIVGYLKEKGSWEG